MTTIAILQKLAAFATNQGKSLDQLTTALLDAGRGEFERLKEFGIRVHLVNDEVVHVWHRGTTHHLANTQHVIISFILGLPEAYSVAELTAQIRLVSHQLRHTLMTDQEARDLSQSLQDLHHQVNDSLALIKSLGL
jgi:fructose-1,6-bisphosphatase/sedoheptulose 1,7-bisphosphatase-like protein